MGCVCAACLALSVDALAQPVRAAVVKHHKGCRNVECDKRVAKREWIKRRAPGCNTYRCVRKVLERNRSRLLLATPKGYARALIAKRGWPVGEWLCLHTLWQSESGWSPTARNPNSSAGGIPQALPASKMAAAGKDWATNPRTQIKWGIDMYIVPRYGTPCSALATWRGRSPHWY